MNTTQRHPAFSQRILILALLATFAPAHADEAADEVAQQTKPESSVSLGLGYISGDTRDRTLFGQYNGLRQDDYYGLLDINIINRDEATGKWTTLVGHNLGLTDRDLRFSQEKQGDWKYYVDYSQLTRYYPRTVNTGMLGAGSTNPTVVLLSAPGTGTDLDLKTKREGIGLGVEKWLMPGLQFQLDVKNEDKDGARLYGKGFACSNSWVTAGVCTANTQWALLMLPEPINSTIRQIDAKLNFSSGNFLLTGGYYGSFYINEYGSLTPTVPNTLNDPFGVPTALDAGLKDVLGLPMALPPSNDAHQLYLDGNYSFTQLTRATFKLAYTHATQNQNFLDSGLANAPAGINDYAGVLDTTLAQVGLTTHPMPKLSVLANVRYEDKKDKSPQALYSIDDTDLFANSLYSLKRLSGKLEGTYRLPGRNRATLGADYESLDRGDFSSPGCAALDPVTGECLGSSVAGLSGLRAKTQELGYRAELRRPLSETLTGAVSYGTSRRDGSSWLKPNSLPATGTTEFTDDAIYSRTAIFPMIFMNRERQKTKVSADWSATERLSLQFMVEDSQDVYSAPTTKGLSEANNRLYSVDAGYTLSDAWQMTAYWSYGDQNLHVAHSSGYIAVIRDFNSALGFGVVGNPSTRLKLGADLSYTKDRTEYRQALDSLASAANTTFYNQQGGLPDVVFDQVMLKLYGKYAVKKNADIRIDVIHVRAKLDEWTWGYNNAPFLYSDNTTVTLNPNQQATFIGATYIYKWR